MTGVKIVEDSLRSIWLSSFPRLGIDSEGAFQTGENSASERRHSHSGILYLTRPNVSDAVHTSFR